MSRWLVTQGDRQFSAADLAELKGLATQGKLGAGDMIQPPGASDWLYASELPELQGVLKRARPDDDDLPARKGLPVAPFAVVAALVIAGAGWFGWRSFVQIQSSSLEILGEDGLALTEMLVTGDPAPLYAAPEVGGAPAGQLSKNEKVQLLAKRGPMYQVKDTTGREGWVTAESVIPGYFFADQKVREDYDPVYNPDRYLVVKNASWMQLPDDEKKNVTVFSFLLQNKSKFEMTDIVVRATIRDKNDKVLEQKEITLDGGVARYSGAMVGTLQPDPKDKAGTSRLMTSDAFNALLKTDPDLQLRWSDGIEVPMTGGDFHEATIDIVQVRAVARKLE
jgi:hypothetical protein